MDIIYFGTSDFSVPFLERLKDSAHAVTGVYTYGDTKKGRGRKIRPNPVKKSAEKWGLKVYEVSSSESDLQEMLSSARFDCAVVVSFGMILPEVVFSRWPDRWLNVHPSLLPAYRGPSPMISTLLDGAGRTGVTINRVVYRVDAGDIYAQTSFNLEPAENLDSLEDKAVRFGAPLLLAVLDLIEAGQYRPRPQNSRGITYTRKLTPGDLVIDWSRPAQEVFNRIRAFSTRPGAYTIYEGTRLKVLASALTGMEAAGKKPGTVETAGRDRGLTVVCGDGRVLRLERLQPEGKRPMDAGSFLNGYHIKMGKVLGKE